MYFLGHALELAEAEGAPKDPIQNLLDNILLGLPLKDQIKIRTMLKEKDDEIIKLKAHGDELVHKLQAVTQENVSLKTQYVFLSNLIYSNLIRAFIAPNFHLLTDSKV